MIATLGVVLGLEMAQDLSVLLGLRIRNLGLQSDNSKYRTALRCAAPLEKDWKKRRDERRSRNECLGGRGRWYVLAQLTRVVEWWFERGEKVSRRKLPSNERRERA